MIQRRTFLVSCLCMLAALVTVQRIHCRGNVEVIESNLDMFPHKVGTFLGTDIKMEDAILKELDTDVYVFRRYVKGPLEEITLYIGYYGTKKGGRTGHNPDACYPGSGWAIIDKSTVKVPVLPNERGRRIKVNCLQVRKDDAYELVYHWYQASRDKVLSSGIGLNIHRFKNKLLNNRNDGAFIRVSTPMTQGLCDANKRLEGFIKKMYPVTVKYWPEEREI